MTPYLLVDGARITAATISKDQLGFCLRLPAQEIRLISGSASPKDLLGTADPRRLGLLVRRLRWARDGEAIDVPMDSPDFVDGFHHAETHDPKAGPARWTTGDAALPPMSFPPWQGAVQLHLTFGEWAGSNEHVLVGPEAALLSAFESLGEDCEFALAQRHYLVEPPLSLFRWGGAPVDDLITGLDNDFAGLAEPETTELVWGHDEYFLRTPYLTMHTHHIGKPNEVGEADILRSGRATLRLLRRKLLRDIADARRIFVFKSLVPVFAEADMHRLHAALRRIGPASLLCVALAPAGETVGGAKCLADGLYCGYVDRFVTRAGPFDQWLSICAATMALRERC
jgi:hypothetical protein